MVHILDYITLEENDTIIFVTGNTSDFSKRNQKKKLHEDIYEDLKRESVGLTALSSFENEFLESFLNINSWSN